MRTRTEIAVVLSLLAGAGMALAGEVRIEETADQLTISTPTLEAAFAKTDYVTGVKRNTFLDKKTGCRDLGFGLDVLDWIMEPGSDEAYRDRLDPELVYEFGNPWHGKRPKHCIEGPQICTRAKEMHPVVVQGKDFVAVRQQFRYRTAAPGKKTGSLWTQWIVFPEGKRYFISMDRIDAVNDSEAMFFRQDMPGHIQHDRGDGFARIYLSYHDGLIAPSEFFENFAPDEKFNYRRENGRVPERFIRAYQIRDPKTGQEGPWLAGMTLDSEVVHEGWCHQRNYVCFIEEIGGRAVRAGESLSAAYVVGYFDSIEEMQAVYDEYRGHRALSVSPDGWKLVRDVSELPPPPVHVVLVGDSTMTTYTKTPGIFGWGQVFGEFFGDNVKITNLAVGGRSSKSFIKEGRWDEALKLKPDYVFIQFGHNDCPGKGDRTTDPASDYQDYLRKYVDDARAIGAEPILVTSMTRRRFGEDGRIRSTLTPYAEAMKKVAAEKGVYCIDLHTRSVDLFNMLGDTDSADISRNAEDRTHFSAKGARIMARLVALEVPAGPLRASRKMN